MASQQIDNLETVPPQDRFPVNYTTNVKQTFDMDELRKLIVSQNTKQPTDAEMYVFKKLCEDLGANPFLKDIHVVKYSSNSPASFITGKDFYTKVARAQGATWEAGVIVIRDGEVVNQVGAFMLETDELVGGWANVHTRDGTIPTTVPFKDYNTGKSVWASMPGTMIRKVALVGALREAYPDRFSNTYTAEEMAQATQFKDIDLVQTIDEMDKAIVQVEPKPKSKPRPKKVKRTPPGDPIGELKKTVDGGIKAMLEQAPEAPPSDNLWDVAENPVGEITEYPYTDQYGSDIYGHCKDHQKDWKITTKQKSNDISNPNHYMESTKSYCNMPEKKTMTRDEFISKCKSIGWKPGDFTEVLTESLVDYLDHGGTYDGAWQNMCMTHNKEDLL